MCVCFFPSVWGVFFFVWWIRDKRLSVSRVDTKNNTAELFTKHLDGFRSRALAKKLRLRFVDMADGGTNGNGR